MSTVLNPNPTPPPVIERTAWVFDDEQLNRALVDYFIRIGRDLPQSGRDHRGLIAIIIDFLHAPEATKLRVQGSKP